MMKHKDLGVLKDMQHETGLCSIKGLGSVSERLLYLIDRLSFYDPDWYHSIIQNVATLDSASTFVPENAMETNQINLAVKHSLNEITILINDKMQ